MTCLVLIVIGKIKKATWTIMVQVAFFICLFVIAILSHYETKILHAILTKIFLPLMGIHMKTNSARFFDINISTFSGLSTSQLKMVLFNAD